MKFSKLNAGEEYTQIGTDTGNGAIKFRHRWYETDENGKQVRRKAGVIYWYPSSDALVDQIKDLVAEAREEWDGTGVLEAMALTPDGQPVGVPAPVNQEPDVTEDGRKVLYSGWMPLGDENDPGAAKW